MSLPLPSSLSESKAPAIDRDFVMISAGSLFKFPSLPFNRRYVLALTSPQPLIRTPKGKKGRLVKKGSSTNASLPPSLECVVTKTHTFRYLCEISGVLNISVTDRYIRGACGGVCTVANTTFQSWAGSIRIHSLTLWLPASTSAAQAVDMYWSSAGTEFIKDSEVIRVIPEGITVTGPMRFTPPRNTLAGDWISDAGSATILFGLSVPNGTVVDFHVSFTLANNLTAVTSSIAAGVLGTVYYLALDGSSSNHLVPQGVPTTH
jgi:hypothetical protein